MAHEYNPRNSRRSQPARVRDERREADTRLSPMEIQSLVRGAGARRNQSTGNLRGGDPGPDITALLDAADQRAARPPINVNDLLARLSGGLFGGEPKPLVGHSEARGRDYYDPRGPMYNVAPAAPGPDLDALFGGGGGGFSAPAVNIADYLAPFDLAEKQARAGADAARPQIDAAHASALDVLGRYLADYNSRAEVARGTAQQDASRTQGIASGAIDPVLADLARQGAPTAPVAAQGALLQGSLTASAGRQQDLIARLQQIQQGSTKESSGAADTIRQAGMTDVSGNLAQALGQIAQGRAGAQRQHAQDSYQRQRDEADFDLRRQTAERDAQKDYLDLLTKTSQGGPTGRDTTDREVAEYAISKGPRAPQAFYKVVGEAKTLGQALASIASIEASGGFTEQEVTDDNGNVSENPLYGLDPNVLRRWAQGWYDEKPKGSDKLDALRTRLLGGQ